MSKLLEGFIKAVIETDEENPVPIAEILPEEIKLSEGYRIRLTPEHFGTLSLGPGKTTLKCRRRDGR